MSTRLPNLLQYSRTVSVPCEGAREHREGTLRQRGRVLGRFQAVPQQHELIAAQARQRVVAPQGAAQALGDRAQQRVAGGVAERIVDQLEAVQVEEQHREAAARARRGEDRLAGAVRKQHAVGQPGQHIARREEADAVLGLRARGDVRAGAAVAREAALGIEYRHA